MKARMPFPDPILPIAVIAMIASVIISVLMNKEDLNNEEANHVEEDLSLVNDSDPFSDSSDSEGADETPVSVVVETKFIEVNSGTEELGFDWIMPISEER